jgi:aspartate/methionine/tyrosine aminotransferase
MIGWRIGWIVA